MGALPGNQSGQTMLFFLIEKTQKKTGFGGCAL
jgi:hypothetical protein